jgi:hypothetical protein
MQSKLESHFRLNNWSGKGSSTQYRLRWFSEMQIAESLWSVKLFIVSGNNWIEVQIRMSICSLNAPTLRKYSNCAHIGAIDNG